MGGYVAFKLLFLLGVSLLVCDGRGPEDSAAPEKGETIVLLHGMGRSRLSMSVLSRRLKKDGYRVKNFPYSAMGSTMDELSAKLKQFVEDEVETPKYHFVAHSLGNIVIRNGFGEPYPEGLGRIVMLAPPNHPAQMAKGFRRIWPYRWFTGESGQKLGDAEFYETLPVPSLEFGVIAGDKTLPHIEKPNDGVVVLESTKLDGMKDWATVHRGHTFIMNSKETAELCVRFLETGLFFDEQSGGVQPE